MGVCRFAAVFLFMALTGAAHAAGDLAGTLKEALTPKHEEVPATPGGTAEKMQGAGGKSAATPADGFTIHVTAPHQMQDGKVEGPYHHYCKPVQEGQIFQCLLFESDAPNAPLVGIEYFIEKSLARRNVPLIQWNRHFHDHEIEIATGRVKVLDVPAAEAKEIAKKAAGTDGVIFHLWQYDAPIPDGRVTFPQSVGHIFRSK